MPGRHEHGDETVAPRVALDQGLLVGSTDAEILQCYVDLVRGWRGGAQRSALRLRQADVAVLVAVLGTERREIERRLLAATACTTPAARRARRLLLAALALGMAAAPVAGASTVGNAGARSLPSAGPATGAAPQASVGRPDESERAAAQSSRIAAPVAATPAPLGQTVAALPSAPVVVTAPVASEGVVSIPSVGISLPIVAGGQSVIDQGVAAHYTAPGWEAAVPPGAVGTYWLAAHHATHGAPFRHLPDVAVGAQVRVTTSNRTFVYTVTSIEVTGLWPGDEAVYGTDPTASVILLQTCVDDTRRLLVHGTLTGAP